MRVLIAGGTGFLGSALGAALHALGHTVLVLSRHPRHSDGDVLAWDPSQPHAVPGAWAERLREVDAVVNLAGENVGGHGRLPTRWTPAFKEALRASRLQATATFVQAIGATPDGQRPKVLVSASAIGYYGDRGEELLSEQSPPGRDFFARLCADWEQAAVAAEQYGVRVVRLRTGIVLERGAMAADLLILASRLGAGGPLGSGQQWWSWIHRADAVGLIVHALQTDTLAGALNVVAPSPRRMREYPVVLGRLLHRPSIVPAPAFALRIALGEISDALLLASQRVAPNVALASGYAYRYTALEDALAAVVRA